jgi:hypothetical protein
MQFEVTCKYILSQLLSVWGMNCIKIDSLNTKRHKIIVIYQESKSIWEVLNTFGQLYWFNMCINYQELIFKENYCTLTYILLYKFYLLYIWLYNQNIISNRIMYIILILHLSHLMLNYECVFYFADEYVHTSKTFLKFKCL